ncbi:MAG TPA: GlxA family transcriptional regulator [Burkholderiaceae bacterium]|nr:GlxA family transcriptional regulator [Burkholderiaceae bacterium]
MAGRKRTEPDTVEVIGRSARSKALRVGFVGFRNALALDIVGPMEAFSLAAESEPGCAPRYRCLLLGLNRRPFVTESGLVIRPDCALSDAPALDTVVIPGGAGLRDPWINGRIATWLRAAAPDIRRIASVCTGIYALAPTGLLDGRRATTHWRFAEDVARRFPSVTVDANAIFVRDGPLYTSAGVTAGLDLALALIEEDFGARLAMRVAREMVVHQKRAGGQQQYSEPLRFQAEHQDRLGELASWLSSNLATDLSVEVLAQRACLSPRHFSRRFKQAFRTTPADFVEKARLDEARRRLAGPGRSLSQVADSVGFASADAFRRAFTRRFGLTPGAYRRTVR